MSQEKTAIFQHRGKDGLYYRYQDLPKANQDYHDLLFKRLGIGEVKDKLNVSAGRTSKRKKVVKTAGSRKVQTRGSVRIHSKRLRNKPATLLPIDEEVPEPRFVPRKKGKFYTKRVEKGAEDLSAEDIEKLKNSNAWFQDFNDYLWFIEGLSLQNWRNVMKQMGKLVAGRGITYQHWKKGVCFAKGRKIDMSTDFQKLYDEGVEFENIHGRDKGNGWLLRHGITKLHSFQSLYRTTNQFRKELKDGKKKRGESA